MSDEMQDFFFQAKVEYALRNPPDSPVTRLAKADYIPVHVRAGTGVVIAYTPTHALFAFDSAGERFVRWEEAWQIKRLPNPPASGNPQ